MTSKAWIVCGIPPRRGKKGGGGGSFGPGGLNQCFHESYRWFIGLLC